MMSHTFAICAYKDSPYLDVCIHSLKKQSVKSKIILCTSTPSPFLEAMAKIHDIPLYVRNGKSDIQDDWNFAYEKADTRLVTIAHQDDCYHRDYAAEVKRCWARYPDTTVFTTDCAILKGEDLNAPGHDPIYQNASAPAAASARSGRPDLGEESGADVWKPHHLSFLYL